MTHIINGIVYTAEGAHYENGFVSFENGVISAVGEMKDFKAQSGETIDAGGGYIVPGFIDAHSHIGIHEKTIGSSGDDTNEPTDQLTPQLRAFDAINPLDGAFEDALAGGVTAAVVAPGSANIIGGQAAAIKTFGRTMEEMVIKAPCAIKMALGENPKAVYSSKGKSPMTRMATAAMLREMLEQARQYMIKKDNGQAPQWNMKYESLIPLLRGEIPAHIHAHRSDDIFTAVRIAKEYSLKLVLIHVSDAVRVAKDLAKEQVIAVAGPYILASPKIETMNATPAGPKALQDAGVTYCITMDHPVTPQQHLSVCAALAMREGLSFEQALEAITLSSAKAAGIEGRTGSLAVGKDADIAVFTANPFTYKARAKAVFVSGKLAYSEM